MSRRDFKLLKFPDGKSIFVNSTENCSLCTTLQKSDNASYPSLAGNSSWCTSRGLPRCLTFLYWIVLLTYSNRKLLCRNWIWLWNLMRLHFNCILILVWPLIFAWKPSQNFWRVSGVFQQECDIFRPFVRSAGDAWQHPYFSTSGTPCDVWLTNRSKLYSIVDVTHCPRDIKKLWAAVEALMQLAL